MFSEILNVITKSIGNADIWSDIGSAVTWGTIFILVLVHYFWYYRPFLKSLKEKDFTNTEAISAASNFGVLGTFIGITFGLVTFDSTNISASVPMLLEGMKTAFFTSIVGMIGAQLLRKKLRNAIEDNAENVNPDDKDYSELLIEGNNVQKKVLDGIGALTNAIGGDGDSTLLSQMKALRLENRDELQGLRKEFTSKFEEFAKTMAENNSKAFIEALNATIRDFNTKIQEQFGENFKQLNIAVGKLLEWQENYKATLESICEQYKVVGQSIEGSKAAMEAIAVHSGNIEKSANSLTDIIVTAEKYEEELKRTLDNLVEISNQAKEAVPNIENLFSSATDKSSQLLTDHIANIVKGQDEFINSMTSANDTLNDIIADAVDKAIAKNNEAIESCSNVKDNIISVCQTAMGTVSDGVTEELNHLNTVSNGIENMFTTTNERTTQLFGDYTTKVSKTIEESIQNLNSSNDTLNDIIAATVDKAIGKNNEIMDKYADVQNDIIKVCQRSLESVDDKLKEELDKMDTITKNLVQILELRSKDIDISNAKAVESIAAAANRLETSGLEVTNLVSDHLTKLAEKNNEDLKAQQSNMIKNLENTANSVISGFAKELANISAQFSKDYKPITDNLRKVMEIASNRNSRF